jgi:hypothetical protein
MKKILISIIAVAVLIIIAFVALGFFKAQDIKKQGRELEQMTINTMVLERIESGDFEISLSKWKNLVDSAPIMKSDLEKFSGVSNSLKEKIDQFYFQANEKYKEVKYLQFLLDAQRKLDLKSTQPKSKGQIETVLQNFAEVQSGLSQNDFSLGEDFDSQLAKMQQEANIFKKSLNDLVGNMGYNSPAIQVSSAGFDKAIDDLKQTVKESLNDWIDLQNEIKLKISDLANINWVNPLARQ